MQIPLSKRLRFVAGKMGGRYPFCNSLVIDSGKRAVIDPGSNRGELRALAEEGVGLVLLSHSHSDHLRDLKEFKQSRVLVNELERAAVESFEGMAELVWFPEEPRDETWIHRKNREVGGWGWPVAGTFADQAELRVGEVTVIALHLPGHTPGHTGFWFPEEKLLFSADIDFTDFGPWYGNAGSSLPDFLASLSRLKTIQPDVTVSGHEAGILRGDLRPRLAAYEQILLARHQRVLAFLDQPRHLEEIVAQGFIYGPYYSADNSLHAPERRMIKHHLAWGMAREEIVCDDGRFRRAG